MRDPSATSSPCALERHGPLPSSTQSSQYVTLDRGRCLQLTHPKLLAGLVLSPQLFEAFLALLLKVGLHLDLCLVEAVDDGVLALGDEDALDLAGVLERDLADVHAAVLFQV